MHFCFMMLMKREFKKCLRYVKRGEITPSLLIKLRGDLEKVIDKSEDFVCIIKLKNDNVFGEEILGTPDNNTGEDLII